MKVREMAAKILPELVELRRYFHMYPEPSFEEINTANKIADELTKLGIAVQRMAKTGVVGILQGKSPGPVVALRADIDALSIQERSGAPYASRKEGYSHACGHDCHITCLLGAAMILAQLKNEIAGTVKFIFQPAEEMLLGAPKMVEEGVIDDASAIFGLHVWGDLPSKRVNIEAGPRMASSDIFKIIVEGKGGHGSAPHQGVDAVMVAAAIIMNLQTIVSREITPLEPVVVHIGKLESGDRYNIISSRAMLEGTCRTFNQDIRKKLPEIIERISESTAAAYRATAKLEYSWGCQPVINDDSVAKVARQALTKLYGQDAFIDMPPLMGSEDFSFYMEKVPGAFAFLGVSNPDKGIEWPQHHACYDVDEDALQVGAALHAQFALDFLSKK